MDQAEQQSLIAQLRERIQQLEARNAILEQRARLDRARLTALMQTTTAFLLTREQTLAIRLGCQHAGELVPGTTQALIWLLDEQSGRLVLHRPDGTPSTHLLLELGQGLAGRGCLAPRPMVFVGQVLEEALAEHDAADQRWLAEQLGDAWPPLSAIAAPLRVEQHPLGVLVLFGGTQSHLLLASDLLFVQALANLIASAIQDLHQEQQVTRLGQELLLSREQQAATQQRLDATQAGLLQTAKLAAVGQLAASVAHEINNPLYAVRNSLYLVEQDLPPDAPQQEFLRLAQNELARIARIIARMRDFYKPAHGDFQPTDLNALIQETLYLAATHLNHSHVWVTLQLDPTLPPITASADQLRQVLLNLILNAADAMPNGGTLTIGSAHDDMHATITIADTGEGIPPDVRERIFEPFFTTKANGTGLGLSVSYHIVAQHGGTLQIESTPGMGTTCTIRLPLHYQPPQGGELTEYATPRLGD
ncbi:sensor histidine kinase [Kallotenue papyrolyticum]|uniref:sensor histidine kinase n=1 Tax=Kallotenue papyrolyticum TaxID=1325125 RepID=UPI00046F8B2B|nr:GAF domain-containing sensor histidine kinase [Kallotenue papyrolyticum]